MKEIYTSLCTRLFDKVTALKVVDMYNGQYTTGDTLDTPAVYIEFVITEWADVGNNSQEGQAIIKLHLCWQNLAATEATYETPLPGAGPLEFLDFVESVHKALQGYAPDNCSPMARTLTEQDTDHADIIVWKNTYQCTYTDETTNPENDMVEVSPALVITHPIQD